MNGLNEHLSDMEVEKAEVLKSRKSFEAEKRRAMAEIQILRKEVATISSQISKVCKMLFIGFVRERFL